LCAFIFFQITTYRRRSCVYDLHLPI